MATLSNSVNGVDVLLSISTNTVTPAYKAIVCSSGDFGLDSTTEGAATVVTRCGTAKAPGSAAYSIKFEGVHNTSISSGSELSGNQLIALNESKATILWKLEDSITPANYYRQSTGFISAYSETSPVDGYTRFTGTIEVTGDIDLTA